MASFADASATGWEARDRDYVPIRDYALIGDCHGSALVAGDGSVDWCCLGRFDAEPVLWRLLDATKGAFFEIRPVGAMVAKRQYLPETNILRTVFATSTGNVAVTDFMPVGQRPETGAADYVDLSAPGWLVRIVEGLEGRAEIRVRYHPAAAPFGGVAPVDERRDGEEPHYIVYAEGGSSSGEASIDQVVQIAAGDSRAYVIAPASEAERASAEQARKLLAITRAFWNGWCGLCRYRGPHAEAVRRSALVLKALTFAPSGAIVAAPTASLPEEPGGLRNWDYRFSWLRDSSFVLHALAALGYGGEARRYCEFLRLCCVQTLPGLQILYGIRGETELVERNLDHLEGYRGSHPVRIGNAAYRQRQVDIYGEVADWALVYHALVGPLDATLEAMIRGAADHVAATWHLPDQGIWEMRGEPRHHVHGKAMGWVALDRALQLVGSNPAWEQARAALLEEILENGIDPQGGHFVQAFDFGDLDAALLLIPLLNMPIEEGVSARTVAAVEQQLREGDYVHRYLTPNGLPGSEGAFLICSFWLVDALLAVGRAEEARTLFESLLCKGNDVDLFPEEVDPASGTFLGNFPQAFTHLALINSAIHLQLYEEGGAAALAGTHADRARKAAALIGRKRPMRRDSEQPASPSRTAPAILDLDGLRAPERVPASPGTNGEVSDYAGRSYRRFAPLGPSPRRLLPLRPLVTLRHPPNPRISYCGKCASGLRAMIRFGALSGA